MSVLWKMKGFCELTFAVVNVLMLLQIWIGDVISVTILCRVDVLLVVHCQCKIKRVFQSFVFHSC